MRLKHLGKYLLLFLFSFQSCSEKNLNLIKSNDRISKVEMKISTDTGLKKFEITEQDTLDSLRIALKQANEIDVQKGGAFEIWAEIKVYEKQGVADFFVQFSKYNGWYMEVDGKTLKCDYMFYLVKKYNDLIKSYV